MSNSRSATVRAQSIDVADQSALGTLCRNLVEDSSAFQSFVSDPLGKLRSLGVSMCDQFQQRAEGRSLSTFLASGGDPLSRLAPGDVDVPPSYVLEQSQEPPWIVPVAIVAVAVASTPAVFSAELGSCEISENGRPDHGDDNGK